MARIDEHPPPVRPEPAPWARSRRRTSEQPAPTKPAQPRRLADPTVDSVAHHLAAHHQVPTDILDGVTGQELLGWHAAEHRTRSIEFLRHTHGAPVSELGDDDPVHTALVKALRDGKPIPNLPEVLDRAAYAQQRRTDGLPLSLYDRQCLELAQVIADRDARKARRRGAA